MSLTRQVILAISPIDQTANTLSWEQFIEDGNSEAKSFSCAYSPPTKGTLVNSLQETVFLGTQNCNFTIQTLINGYSLDGELPYKAEAITNRVDPSFIQSQDPDTKRFVKIEFPSIVPEDRDVSVHYARDEEYPHQDSVSWEDFIGDGNRKAFPRGLARWLHLRVLDEAQSSGQEVFSSFKLHYYSLGSRDRITSG